jgi:hypothetical protein
MKEIDLLRVRIELEALITSREMIKNLGWEPSEQLNERFVDNEARILSLLEKLKESPIKIGRRVKISEGVDMSGRHWHIRDAETFAEISEFRDIDYCLDYIKSKGWEVIE